MFYIDYIPLKNNTHADVLKSLVATLALPPKVEQKVLVASRNLYHPKQALEINKYAKQNLKNKTVCEASTSMELGDL